VHPPRSNRAYRNVARILRPLLYAIQRRDWRGTEHLPVGQGFIAAGNHVTNLDPVTFAHYLYDNGHAPKILAKHSLFTVPVVGWVLRTTGQIPVFRNTTDAGKSLAAAEQALAAGECVAVFPEGTLTRDPDLWPMLAKTGVARLALVTRAPVVAGPPVDLSDLYDRPLDAATLREATSRVMAAITGLLAEVRGETPPAQVYDMRRQGDPHKGIPGTDAAA
jgi:1-acyl-sn-glycerol-3-phosphate acyltransferase